MGRRYYILDRVNPKEIEALESCIGAMETQRYSLDFTKILIKTNEILTFGTEYTYEEILAIMQTTEWQKNEL